MEWSSPAVGADMFLAFREMRRSVVRFGLLAVAVALLVFLILFQQALRDGLITSFVGAIRNQNAPVLVYNVSAQRVLQASVITPEMEARIRDAEGIGKIAHVGQGTFTVTVDGAEPSDAAIIGTDNPQLFRPSDLSAGRGPDAPGQAVGSAADFDVGDTVKVIPFGKADATTITVVGVAQSIELSVTPTLFTDFATFESATRSANPAVERIRPNVLAVVPATGVSAERVVDSINAAAPDADALTRADAAAKSPGVAQVSRSFQVIFALYGFVVPLVTGLFFLILTLQKARSLVLLRAIGARSAVLVRSLVVQVFAVMVVGLGLGIALFYPLSQGQVGGLSLRFDLGIVLGWSAVLLALALLSAVVSMRRVLRIDPIAATTGEGVR